MVTKIKTLEYVIDTLVDNGVDTFFLVTGGAIVPTVDYIGRKSGVKYYCFQHEQSAAMAAEGYYRTSGKLAAVLSTSGPGAQNLLNGICGCWYESIPCIFITGQVSTYENVTSVSTSPRQVGFQETPVVESFKYFTKYSVVLDKVKNLKSELKRAIELAVSGRPGPVLLDFPVDIQNSLIEPSQDIWDLDNINDKFKIVHDQVIQDQIKVLNNKLKNSKRPLLLIGHGVRLGKALNEIKTLVKNTKLPFVVSWGGFDIMPHNHPQFIGDIGVYGSRKGNFAIQNCDLLISIGSRLDTRQTGGNLETFSRDSYKIMVDVDGNEVGKDRGLKIDLPIICDAKRFLNLWINSTPKTNSTEWANRYKTINLENRPLKPDVLTSYEFLEELNTQLPETCTIIPDEGGHLVWSMQSITPKENQRMFSNFGNSSMGYGLPSAIGATIGSNDPVICIDGDGGFQMNIQELQTVKHYNLPLKIFIINNDCYGIIKQFQDSYFDSRYTATETQDYSVPDFVKLAEVYGIKSLHATKDNYKEVIRLALQEKGSILVNVIIDREQKLTPKLEFGNPLEDMSPYISDKEIKNNMIIDMIPRRDNSQGWVTLEK
jgi:acetolactate synthase-1/2/3 large subunit